MQMITFVPTFVPRCDGESDRLKLEHLFSFINNRYFDDRIQATVCWEIPLGSVTISSGTPGKALQPRSSLWHRFAKATHLLQAGQRKQAQPLLQECADAGHPDSELLMSHLLKQQGDSRWEQYATAYNRHLDTTRAVPAACYYPQHSRIALHPHLCQRRAPQFVLKYLLFHECCHQLVESDERNPHPPAFMEWERRAPQRDKAIAWLEREGFPTLQLPAQ